MKEYRIMAYFSADAPRGYQPRSYKRKIFTSLDAVQAAFPEAVEYYSRYKYLVDVKIESRDVTDWR